MTQETNETVIRAAFETALVEGLKGAPVVSKDGDVATHKDGSIVLAAPEASFLSVVRAYLKDLVGGKEEGKPKVPQTGTPKGTLAEFMKTPAGLPFGNRAQ